MTYFFSNENKKQKLIFRRLILIYLFLILSCKPPQTNEKDLLKISIESDPSSLDPIFAVDLTSQKINSLLFKKLFKFKKDGKVEGDLVKEFSLTGKFLNLKLESLVTANGVNLKSDDVIYSLNRLKTEKGPRKSKYAFIKTIQKVSDYELKLELDSNNQKFIELLALAPASIYQEIAHRQDGSFKSSGIYYLEKWNKNDSIEMGSNFPFEESRFPKTLILQVLNQPSSAIYLFRKGNIDVMKIPYFLLAHPAVKENSKKILKGKSVQYIAVNHNNPCFDLPFRKALNLAIDRDLIIEKIFESSASKINASVTNEYLELYTKEKFYDTYDMNLAKKHLAESKCYPQILNQTLELRMRADDENKAKGQVIAQYLKNLGLKISILPMEKTKLYKENGEKKGDFTLLTWYIDYDSIYNFIDPLFAKDSFGNGGNRSFYSNPQIEEYIRQIRINPEAATDPVKIVQLLKEDYPWIFLWSIHENYVLSTKATQFPELIQLLIQ